MSHIAAQRRSLVVRIGYEEGAIGRDDIGAWRTDIGLRPPIHRRAHGGVVGFESIASFADVPVALVVVKLVAPGGRSYADDAVCRARHKDTMTLLACRHCGI